MRQSADRQAIYRKFNKTELLRIITFAHYFMTGIVNDAESSILNWKNGRAQGKLTPKRSYQGL